jgi:hypothetical protein
MMNRISGDVPTNYAVRVARVAQDVEKSVGAGMVQLIEQSGEVAPPPAPPVGPDGQGAVVNTYA